MVDPRKVIERASQYQNPAAVLLVGISGVILAVAELGIDLLDAIFGLFTNPLRALGDGAGFIADALLGGAGLIIWTAARTTQQALLPGSPWAVGPLAFAIGVASAGLGLYVFAQFLQARSTSDFSLGTFTDLDIPGPLDIGVRERDDN